MFNRYLLIAIISLLFSDLEAQTKNHFSLEANYGIQGNFALSDYGETGTDFYSKNIVGTIGGIELKYNFGKRSAIGVGYARSVNGKTVNYEDMGFTSGGVNAMISDFRIRDINNFFQIYYQYSFGNRIPGFAIQAGLYYLATTQQTISIAPQTAYQFDERRVYRLNNEGQGGIFIGLQYSRMIDTKFELGIRSRIYYTLSVGELESISLTPTLTYHFPGKKK